MDGDQRNSLLQPDGQLYPRLPLVDQPQCLLEMAHRLAVGAAAHHPLGGEAPGLDRRLRLARGGQMVRQEFGCRSVVALCQMVRDRGVELAALAMQEALIGGILHQGMLEQIARIGARAAPRDQA